MNWGYFMEHIGSRVKSLRLSKRLNQEQLAELCEVSQPAIAKIEKGITKTVKGKTLEMLASALSSTTTFILYGSETEDDHEHDMMQAEMTAIFRDLPTSDKETLLRLARGILPKSPSTTPPPASKARKEPLA